jgi:hypothetical protein
MMNNHGAWFVIWLAIPPIFNFNVQTRLESRIELKIAGSLI